MQQEVITAQKREMTYEEAKFIFGRLHKDGASDDYGREADWYLNDQHVASGLSFTHAANVDIKESRQFLPTIFRGEQAQSLMYIGKPRWLQKKA